MGVSLMKEECDTCAVRKGKAGGMEAERGRKLAGREKKQKTESEK